MPFRVLYLAALPAGAEVWTRDKCEAYVFDHYADADALAEKIRRQDDDIHTHAVVLSGHEHRGPVQMRLPLQDAPPRHRRRKKTAHLQHSHAD